MDFFKMPVWELAMTLQEIQTEIYRRQEAILTDDASIIRGAEAAKRAIVVAAAGKHPMLFVGAHGSGKTLLRALAHKLGVISFEALPCPCGNLMSPKSPCSCKPAQIKKHQALITSQEINVETCMPSARDLECKLPQTTLENMARQVKNAATFTDHKLDEHAEALLRAAYNELNLDALARQTIINVARTIANLDHSKGIQASHIAEATNYRTLLRQK